MDYTHKQFVEFEKINSSKFLKSLHFVENRFDDNEYYFLEPLFKDTYMIKKIYEIIEEILKKQKICSEFKFLVIADFLFSMTSSNLVNPSELVFKTTRTEYIERIILRSIINYNFTKINSIDYCTIHKKLLIGLRLEGFLKKTELRTVNNSSWVTEIYFKIKFSTFDSKIEIPLGYSPSPFILVKIGNDDYSLASFRNIWKLKRKKREMEDVLFSNKEINKINQTQIFLSNKLYIFNKEIIEIEKEKILKSVGCENLEVYFLKLKQLLSSDAYIKNILLNSKKKKKVFSPFLEKKTKNDNIELITVFQKLLSISLLEKNLFEKNLYLPSFMDNRGRLYYATLLSPTFYKIFRFIYSFSEIKKFDNLIYSTFYKKIIRYVKTVAEFNLDHVNSYIAIILFIEVGKFFIKTEKELFIKTEILIKKGIDQYKTRNLYLGFDDQLYVNKIYCTLDDLFNKQIDTNTIIFKDATASGLQNYGIISGYQNDKLHYLNLNSDDWCDTYKYLINKYLKNDYPEFSKRKYWKNTIMTIPYSCSWVNCFKKFVQNLEDDGILYQNFDEFKKENIKKIHKDFYNSIKKNIKKEFYKGEIKNLQIFKYNKWQVVSKKEYKINYKKMRDKYTDTLYMLIEDKQTEKRAISANNMHYLDSKLVKEMIKEFDIIPIHDCFGVRLSHLHLLMDRINKYYEEIIGEKIYSIHVIL